MPEPVTNERKEDVAGKRKDKTRTNMKKRNMVEKDAPEMCLRGAITRSPLQY